MVVEDLNVVITDAIPKDTAFAGVKPLQQTSQDASDFSKSVAEAVGHPKGDLYLILGGIGSGKTTFLKRYEELIARKLLDESAFTFHLDFLGAPLSSGELEDFVWQTVLDTLRDRYSAENVESREVLEEVFKGRLRNLGYTELMGLVKGSPTYEAIVGKHLLAWQQDLSEYVPRLLQVAGSSLRRTTVLIIDNVDQLDPEYQAQIFLLAQRTTRKAECVTIIAMREESYYAPSIANTFTAYTTHRFHIASPQFLKMIRNRIEYAIKALENVNAGLLASIPGVDDLDITDLSDFLRIVEQSVFAWSNRITRFIECICFGNMRAALQMFTTFLASGATDVGKMLLIHRRDGSYRVAFHEFLKSVMLQDRSYYKEDQSPILNIFNCTAERNSSHFTAIRVLTLLLGRRGESTPEGQGYVELSRLVFFLADVFDNVADITATLDRLLNRHLIEVNTRSTRTVRGASHLRVTAAGWYYVEYLASSFAYLDLVLQDTPLNDGFLEEELRRSVHQVNNLADREQDKLARVKMRFDRTQQFLDYLVTEENREFDLYEMSRLSRPLSEKSMPWIIQKFKNERAYVEKRLQDGRFTDVPDEPATGAEVQLDLGIATDESGEVA